MTELVPPPDVPAVASAAAIGDLAADLTPPHRSPRALVVVVLRVRAAVWLAGAEAWAFAAGAVDLAVTLPEAGCVGRALTAAELLFCGIDVVAAD
jgi:hypothetical protein